jgi:hypothetical protein
MSRKNKSYNLKQTKDPRYKQIITNLKVVGLYDEITGKTYTKEDMEISKETIETLKKKFG